MFKTAFIRLLFIFFYVVAAGCLNGYALEPESRKARAWADSVFKSLEPRERIGQLFMVAAYSNKGTFHEQKIKDLIRNYNIGGLIFFQDNAREQIKLTNTYQELSEVPLLIGMDGEWGPGMRLDSVLDFPRQMTLGAIQDNALIRKMGEEIAGQFSRMGMHINFAPVVDVNSNPANPVIGNRSFGENKWNVARKGAAYMKGMQENGVLATAKHFPGHGDTDSDSHLTLPVINHDKERLNNVELFPFRYLIEEGVKGVMVAHLHVPALDSTPNLPTTLSENVVQDLLKEEMGFNGLTFTDALNMQGVAKFYEPGRADLKALKAGNDVLLYPENVPVAVKEIYQAAENGTLSWSVINKRVKKILRYKYATGAAHYQELSPAGIYEDINNNKVRALRYKLYSKALTVLSNEDELLPIKHTDTSSIATFTIGREQDFEFMDKVDSYTEADHYALKDQFAPFSKYQEYLEKLKDEEVVIVGLHDLRNSHANDYDISSNSRLFLDRLREHTEVIVSVYGTPYSVRFFDHMEHVICAYEDNETTRKLVPQLIFGAIGSEGELPVSASGKFREGRGLKTPKLGRLGFAYPENVNMDARTLKKIDTIAREAIDMRATPGCQILVAKDGKIVHNKAYGHLTYDEENPVTEETIYDLASITKVAATTQAVMFLYERGMIDLDAKASRYLPSLRNTNKEDVVIRDILTHQAGLKSYLRYWERTLDSTGHPSDWYYCDVENSWFCKDVTPGIHTIKAMDDSIWKWTVKSEMREPPDSGDYGYKYSDIGFYIMKRLVEKQLNQPMDDFLEQNIYHPLGARRLTFNPLNSFKKEVIAPTEKDQYFRNTLVKGTVHDPGAAMMGGVAGHAGLFSNALDLAKLMQMNLQNGYYGGRRYFREGTMELFTKRQFKDNRRGLGWDKPLLKGYGPTSDYASPNTFGHSGFTGGVVWADPDYNLLYIFLSNRVYPDAGNLTLIREDIRTRIQSIIYKSLRLKNKYFRFARNLHIPPPHSSP